jgi:phage/plasmid-associated DNA primase
MFDPFERDGHTISLTETVSAERLKIILDNFDNFGWRESTLKKHENLKEAMNTYYDELIKNGNKSSVQYTQTSIGCGRYYAHKFCLQSMPRELRHALVYDTHVDLDIYSAHPSLLVNYCLNHDVNHKYLTEYLENRDKFYSDLQVVTPDPKKAILTIMNGGTMDLKNAPVWWKPLNDELQSIRNHMMMDPENKNILEYIQINKNKEWNISGSLLNYIVSDLENYALTCICYCLQKRGYIIESLAFDGLLVRNTGDITQKILDEVMVQVQKITRFRGLKLTIKPMTRQHETSNDLLESVKLLGSDYLNETWVLDKTKRTVLELSQNLLKHSLNAEMPIVFGTKGCFVGCGGTVYATIDANGSFVQCKNCTARFPTLGINLPIPMEDRFSQLREFVSYGSSLSIEDGKFVGGTIDGLISKPENMTLAENVVYDAVTTGGGKARLFSHVANGRIRYDGRNTWFVDNNVWVPYSSQKELARMRRFEMDEVFPFVVKHRHVSLQERKLLQFDGDSDASDMEKLRALVDIYDPNFPNTMDSDDDLLAFTDVAFNLATRKIIPLAADLRISKTVGYAFPREKGPHYQQLKELFEKIHPNEELRNYFLRACASGLHGSRLSRNVHLHSGDSGRNGKTLISTLCMATWGDYFCDLPAGYLQRSPDNNGPDPMTLELRGKRFAVSSEPPEDKKLQADVIKRLSGGDRARARDLYASGTLQTFQLNIHLHILCNKQPKIDSDDGGLRDRLKTIPFRSMFVDNPEEVDPENHIYQANEDLKTKIKDWKQDFMWILLNEYYDHNWTGQAPEEILRETKGYMDRNASEALLFLSEKTEYCSGHKIKSGEVITGFLEWCQKENISLPSIATNKISPMIQTAAKAVFKGKVIFNPTCSFTNGVNRTQSPGYINLRFKSNE